MWFHRPEKIIKCQYASCYNRFILYFQIGALYQTGHTAVYLPWIQFKNTFAKGHMVGAAWLRNTQFNKIRIIQILICFR